MIKKILQIQIIRDIIHRYLKYEDLGIYFTCKELYKLLDKDILIKLRNEYEKRMYCNRKLIIPIMTKNIFNNLNKFSYTFLNLKSYYNYSLYELYMKIVSFSGLYLDELIYKDNFDICMQAIINNEKSLEFVNNHTMSNINEIYKEAIKKDGNMLKYVLNQGSNDIYLIYILAIINKSSSLKYILNHDIHGIEHIYDLAIRIDCSSIQYMKNHYIENIFDLYQKGVENNGLNLKYIERHYIPNIYDIYMKAVQSNIESIKYIKNHYIENIFEIYKECVSKNGMLLEYVVNHSILEIEELYMISIEQNIFAIEFVKRHDIKNIFNIYMKLLDKIEIHENNKSIKIENLLTYILNHRIENIDIIYDKMIKINSSWSKYFIR